MCLNVLVLPYTQKVVISINFQHGLFIILVPMPPNHEANRNMMSSMKKQPMRPVVTGSAVSQFQGHHNVSSVSGGSSTQGTGQHDYIRSEQNITPAAGRKPGVPDAHITNRYVQIKSKCLGSHGGGVS